MRFLGCICCVFVLGALVAQPAAATFPGRDGLLAVQPFSGRGVVIVNARGGRERRICTDRARCGSPRSPRWSPDGRALVFNASTAVHLIYPDGSCMDCQIGGAGTPAFTAKPTLVSVESGGKLVEEGIDGIRKATISARTFSDAVWSAQGELAGVDAGHVWAGSPRHLRLLGPGSAPSWSPTGAQLAIVRQGWVIVIGLRRRTSRRLVQGSAPAWSPDGKSIAFIGAGHDLRIVPASGGVARRVGRVRGLTVDWQRVPEESPRCAAPTGSTVLASSSTAVLTSDANSAGDAYMGCLRTDGRERFLERLNNIPGISSQAVSAAAVGDGHAALANENADFHYGGSTDQVAVFDLRTGGQLPNLGGEATSCSPILSDPCQSATIDSVVVGNGGVSAAHETTSYPVGSLSHPLLSVSCPTTSLCVAVDGFGHGFTSSNPAALGATWVPVNVLLDSVSCPSASLCAGQFGQYIYTTTDPTGGAGAWTGARVESSQDSFVNGVSCPSISLCVAIDDRGNVLTSTNPTGGAGTWTATDIDGTTNLDHISCLSSALCIVTDSAGHAVVSTDPTGGASAWHAYPMPGASVSCASPTLCVAVDGTGHAYTSTDPTSGTAWTPASLPGNPIAVACPSTSLCVAAGRAGTLDVSTDPASGTWTSTVIDNGHDLRIIACANSSVCVAGDSAGNLVASSAPTGGTTAWTPTLVDGSPCTAVTACTAEEIAAVDSSGFHVVDTSSEPGTGSLLTGLNLSGATLSWNHSGTPQTVQLHP